MREIRKLVRWALYFAYQCMLLGIADDIDIIGIGRRVVEEAFVPFKRETARIGLTVNTSKTKYMIAGRQRGSKRDVGSEVVLGGEKIEVVEFVYFGTLVTCDNDVTREVKRRFAAANRAFYGLHDQLKSVKLFERKVLRTILGGKQANGIWRRRMNHELY